MAFRSKRAFTLAEVLITLAVIGIIAAMTIPAVIQSTQNAELRIVWKKSFSDLNQAVSRVISDNGGTLKDNPYDSSSFKEALLQYLSYSKDCDFGQVAGSCWANNTAIKDSNDGEVWSVETVRVYVTAALLANGSTIFYQNFANDCEYQGYSQFKSCGNLIVDVNGSKGPNLVGRDIFFMWVAADGLYPYGVQGDGRDCDNSGWGCGAAYLKQ